MVNWVFWRVEYYSYGLKMSVSTLLHLCPSTAGLHKFVDYFNRRSFREFFNFYAKVYLLKVLKMAIRESLSCQYFSTFQFAKVYTVKIFWFFRLLLLSIEIGLWKVPKGLSQRNLMAATQTRFWKSYSLENPWKISMSNCGFQS